MPVPRRGAARPRHGGPMMDVQPQSGERGKKARAPMTSPKTCPVSGRPSLSDLTGVTNLKKQVSAQLAAKTTVNYQYLLRLRRQADWCPSQRRDSEVAGAISWRLTRGPLRASESPSGSSQF